jgi:hypothetical protein
MDHRPHVKPRSHLGMGAIILLGIGRDVPKRSPEGLPRMPGSPSDTMLSKTTSGPILDIVKLAFRQ